MTIYAPWNISIPNNTKGILQTQEIKLLSSKNVGTLMNSCEISYQYVES